MKGDYRSAALDPPTRALLDFAVMATRDATQATPQHLDELRAHGFRDEDILDAVQIIGFFNYYTRLADVLGVGPEAHWPPE